MQQPAILSAFSVLSAPRQSSGKRHTLALCLALFTMAVVAGNQDFSRLETGSTAIKGSLQVTGVRVAFEKSIPLNSLFLLQVIGKHTGNQRALAGQVPGIADRDSMPHLC